jgi:hypothetical protein
MRHLAFSRLISIFVTTLALGACVVDEWSDPPPKPVDTATTENKVPATATTRGGGTDLMLSAPDASDGNAPDRTAKMQIRAFGGGTIRGTATFTQHGSDVLTHVDLTSCPEGPHLIQVFGGYSCDSIESQGSVWNPPRGEHFGSEASTIQCGADKRGSLDFTRPGGSPTTSWTVGDGDPVTDIKRQLIVVFSLDDPPQHHACGGFF